MNDMAARYEEAKNAIDLAVKFFSRYSRMVSGMDPDDLHGVAIDGFLEAYRTFKGRGTFRFWAGCVISQRLKSELRRRLGSTGRPLELLGDVEDRKGHGWREELSDDARRLVGLAMRKARSLRPSDALRAAVKALTRKGWGHVRVDRAVHEIRQSLLEG